MRALSLRASGMVTAVGLDGPSTCAAIRAAISGGTETGFFDQGGERILGCSVPLDSSLSGIARLSRLASSALKECLPAAGSSRPESIPFFLCLSEKERPERRPELDQALPEEIQKDLRLKFHKDSKVFSLGKTSVVHALKASERAIYEGGAPFCLIGSADSLLSAPALRAYESANRLLTSLNSNGFIPGEAGSALLVGPLRKDGESDLACKGSALATEKATVVSEEPLRADGLTAVIRQAVQDAGGSFDDLHYRITDLAGEQYGFKEAALAVGRSVRKTKPEFDLWHPADCVGDIGAAMGPCVIGVALAAFRKGYAPGEGVLCHFGNDSGERGALVLSPVRDRKASR